jgi:hypothetical protein
MKNILGKIHTNIGGKNTSKRIIVFESDDWGSLRMPDQVTFNKLLNAGIPVDKSIYCKFDGLERNNDIELLYDVFDEVEHKHKKKVVFTFNCVSANPNFIQMKTDNMSTYHIEKISNTYSNIQDSNNVLRYIIQGKEKGYFNPQYHGRDHVNVPMWLNLLQNDHHFKLAFEYMVWGLSLDVFPNLKKSIQATYDSNDLSYVSNSILEGIDIFQESFGEKPKSFIPNNYIYSDFLENILLNQGINILQGMKYQLLPLNINGIQKQNRISSRRFLGFNTKGTFQSIRNCTFEPTELNDKIEDVLKSIELAFCLKKPAIICTHRINYTSRISYKNRDRNIIMLKELIFAIIKKWPDVLFASSDMLPNLLEKK